MNKILTYIGESMFLCLISFLIQSCEQHEALGYKNDPRISFARGDRGYGQQDSVVHSFFTVPESQNRDTVWIEMNLSGLPASVSRTIPMEQTNVGEPGAAVAGTHYVAFTDEEMKTAIQLPANAVSVKIPVILLRDKSLYNEKVILDLTVGENEYFKPGIDTDRNFRVTTTARADKPEDWDTKWKYAFGDWGSVKMGFIVNYVGFTAFGEDIDASYRSHLKIKSQEKLLEYNATHEQPLCEDVNKVHAPGEKCNSCVSFL